MNKRTIRILGTRGIPAAHGGFETFAEQLAVYLVAKGWRVIVYCQRDGIGPISEDSWNGIERVIIPTYQTGPKGTIIFDWKSIKHAARTKELCLTLGYNTAFLCAWLAFNGIPNIINMDGVEWRRAKWSRCAKLWFWLNDWAGCWLGTHLVADHPEIALHLETRAVKEKITTIPYGAPRLLQADASCLADLGLESSGYLIVVARPEPENSILEIVRSFSSRRRGVKLAVVGRYDEHNKYHAAVKAAASDEVLFLGSIYDKPKLQALRWHSLAYLHGHQVGGTNPSLVEALGAGNAIIAHDNRFNRWVAGSEARYFVSPQALSSILDELLSSRQVLAEMKLSSIEKFESRFKWEHILGAYENLLERWLPTPQEASLRIKTRPSESATRMEPSEAAFAVVDGLLNGDDALLNGDAD